MRRLASTPEITSASAKGSRPGRFFHPTRVANVYCPGNAISLWVSMLLHWKYAWLIGWILHFNCTTKFRGNSASLFLSDLMNKLEFFSLIGNWLNWRIPAIVKLWLDQVSIIYIIGYEILLNIYIYIYHHNICLLFFIFLFFFYVWSSWCYQESLKWSSSISILSHSLFFSLYQVRIRYIFTHILYNSCSSSNNSNNGILSHCIAHSP